MLRAAQVNYAFFVEIHALFVEIHACLFCCYYIHSTKIRKSYSQFLHYKARSYKLQRNTSQEVARFVDFWVTHMEARGKCEGEDGVAALCRALPVALPVATRSAPVFPFLA